MRTPLILYLVFCLGIGLCALLLFRHWRTWRNIDSWTPVPARVIETSGRYADGFMKRDTFRLHCKYQYQYGAATYTNSTIIPNGVQERQQQLIWFNLLDAKRETGETIPCYVNPADPTYAVLARGDTSGGLRILIFGCIGCGIALALLLIADKPWRRFRPTTYICGSVSNSIE